MPEGPEVQVVVNGLRDAIAGQRIASVRFTSGAESMIERFHIDAPEDAITHQPIRSVQRRGKYIDIAFASGTHMLIHLMMTGKLALHTRPRFLRCIFTFENGTALFLGDQRKWARIIVLPGEKVDDYPGVQKLGVDVLDDAAFTLARFKALLTSRRNLHAFLLDQTKLSGLGNIYVNEALFRARLHPLRTPRSLNAAEAEALYRAICAITREAVRQGGTTFSDFWSPDGRPGSYQHQLQVFRRAGEPCLHCGTPIERLALGNRGAFYCPKDQSMASARSSSSASI